MGAIGTFAIGILMLGEALTIQRAVASLLIVPGMVTMKLAS